MHLTGLKGNCLQLCFEIWVWWSWSACITISREDMKKDLSWRASSSGGPTARRILCATANFFEAPETSWFKQFERIATFILWRHELWNFRWNFRRESLGMQAAHIYAFSGDTTKALELYQQLGSLHPWVISLLGIPGNACYMPPPHIFLASSGFAAGDFINDFAHVMWICNEI